MKPVVFETDQIRDALVKAVEQTFINMAFIDVVTTESHEISPTVSQLIIIDITRPNRGSMLMRLPLALKQQVVEIIHSDSWSHLNSREIDDCLLEVLNVLAGNFLHFLFGENIKYNMTFPQIAFDEDEVDEEEDALEYFFDAEGIVFAVAVKLD